MSFEQQVTNAWYAGVIFTVVMVVFFVLSHRSEDHGPTLLARLMARYVMSRDEARARRSVPSPVSIPVSSMPYQDDGMDDDEADIDAENAGIPPSDRDITAEGWIDAMARAPGSDGKKYRFSSNQIYKAVGGDRNAVLARVRAIRDTTPPAEYFREDGTRGPATHPVTGRRTAA